MSDSTLHLLNLAKVVAWDATEAFNLHVAAHSDSPGLVDELAKRLRRAHQELQVAKAHRTAYLRGRGIYVDPGV